MLADRVSDAARPVSVVQAALERKPAQLVKQAQQFGDAMASFGWWTDPIGTPAMVLVIAWQG